MALQYKFFKIPMNEIESWEEEINRFLRGARINRVKQETIDCGPDSFWTLVIEYQSGAKPADSNSSGNRKNRVDYREILSTEDFAVFTRLRDWRKTTAEKEGNPLYNVFKNEHLAAMAENRVKRLEDLKEIKGVGEGKIDKYGAEVISVVAEAEREQKEETAGKTAE